MELKTLTIKSVTSNDKKKDGTPFTGKFGPYWVIRADTLEEGYVSWFAKTASDLKMGDKIEGTLEITTSEKDGKTYTNKNFKFPKQDDVMLQRIAKLESRVMKLELGMERMIKEEVLKAKSDLCLELTGKVQTTSDFNKMSEPHPLYKNDPFEGLEPSDEPAF